MVSDLYREVCDRSELFGSTISGLWSLPSNLLLVLLAKAISILNFEESEFLRAPRNTADKVYAPAW